MLHGCDECHAIDFAVGKLTSQTEFDDPVGIVGLVVGARDDKLRHSRNNAFRGGSYAAMMNDGAAARKEVLKARVRDVKHAGRARSLGRIQADEQASQVEFPAGLKSSGLEMLNIKIG